MLTSKVETNTCNLQALVYETIFLVPDHIKDFLVYQNIHLPSDGLKLRWITPNGIGDNITVSFVSLRYSVACSCLALQCRRFTNIVPKLK